MQSKSPQALMRLMAVDKGVYSSEKVVRELFQMVMREEVSEILRRGYRQVARALEVSKEEVRNTLQIGLEGVEEYIILFGYFAELVRGDFFKYLPSELQQNFSQFFRVEKSQIAEYAYTRVNVEWDEERQGVVENQLGLIYKMKKEGKWKFMLKKRMVLRVLEENRSEIYGDNEETKREYMEKISRSNLMDILPVSVVVVSEKMSI
jgi:alpha-glucosidase (family GH31 glycosyl hydrolase)